MTSNDESTVAVPFVPFGDGLDYTDPGNWFITPGADALPGALDVFVLTPTVVFDPDKDVYVDVADPAVRDGFAEFAEIAVHPVFDGLAVNLHMPLFRQANGARLFEPADPMTRFWDDAAGGPTLPTKDVYNAFAHLVKHRHPDSWFMLYSHSQGSVMASMLLARFIPQHLDAALQGKLGVAFLTGWGLTDSLLDATCYRASSTPTDLNTIVSWNTATPAEVARAWRATWLDGSARAVNPITFDTSTNHVEAGRNSASYLRYFDGPELQRVESLTGAQVVVPADQGGVYTGQVVRVDLEAEDFRSPAEIAAQDASNLGYTHHWDLSLFAGPIRQNLQLRLGIAERA